MNGVYTIKWGDQLKGGNENVKPSGGFLTNKKNEVGGSMICQEKPI